MIRRRLIAAVLAAGAFLVGSTLHAEPIPVGWKAQNLEPIGFIGVEGRLPTKLEIKRSKQRWYLFTAYPATDTQAGQLVVIDVTDPRNPKRVNAIAQPPNTEVGQVTLNGDLLITNLEQRFKPDLLAKAMPDILPVAEATGPDKDFADGVILWDIKDPANPKRLGAWESGASGAHRNGYWGGKYAYLSSSKPGFRGMQLVILDVSDPTHPKEAANWWQYGQKADETLGPGQVTPTLHGPAMISPDGRMLTMGYSPSVVNLDISDLAHLKLIGKLQMIPPFAYSGSQSVHTVLPLSDPKLLYVSGDPEQAKCNQAMPLQAIVDNADPSHPKLLSVFPPPRPSASAPYKNFCERPGRFGPHNVSTEIYNPDVKKPGDLLHVAYLNAGLRVYRISDPQFPTEVGWFLPADSRSPTPSQTGLAKTFIAQDVLLDTRDNIFMVGSGGIYVLRDTGADAAIQREAATARRLAHRAKPTTGAVSRPSRR